MGHFLQEENLNVLFRKSLKTGIVAVTDPDKNCAAILSVDGNWFHSFGEKGADHGKFNCPTGVTILQNGDIAVADWENRIQVDANNVCKISSSVRIKRRQQLDTAMFQRN